MHSVTSAFGAALLIASVATSASAGSAMSGKELYNTYCVICHGPNMVNPGMRAYDLRKFPLNDFPRFEKSVKQGKRGQNEMPAWGDILSDEEIDHLWAYVKTRGK